LAQPAAFVEAFPIFASAATLCHRQNRFTLGRGVGALDMMSTSSPAIMRRAVRPSRGVVRALPHPRQRRPQKLQLRIRTGIRSISCSDAWLQMENSIEHGEPLTAIADHVGVSIGKLERLSMPELRRGSA